MAEENKVVLSVAGYNQIKAENTKFSLFMDRLFEDAELRSDYAGIDFNVRRLEELIRLVYPDRYKKKLSALRMMQTKLSKQKLEWEAANERTD